MKQRFLIYPFCSKERQQLLEKKENLLNFFKIYQFNFEQYFETYGTEAVLFAVLMQTNYVEFNESFLFVGWKKMNKLYNLFKIENFSNEVDCVFEQTVQQAKEYLRLQKNHLYIACVMKILKNAKNGFAVQEKKMLQDLLFFCIYFFN